MDAQRIILFDGVCNLCNGSVNFIIDHDKEGQFSFASLQSDSGQKILDGNGLETNDFDSFVYYEAGKVFKKSTAALQVAKRMGGLWKFSAVIFSIIPVPIRDFVYSLIAKNRYKLFGKRDACRMPTPELQSRFL